MILKLNKALTEMKCNIKNKNNLISASFQGNIKFSFGLTWCNKTKKTKEFFLNEMENIKSKMESINEKYNSI